MEPKDIVARLGYIAEDLAPMIGGPKAAAAVEVAKVLIDAGKKAVDTLDGENAAPLPASLAALEQRITAYAQDTADGLRS